VGKFCRMRKGQEAGYDLKFVDRMYKKACMIRGGGGWRDHLKNDQGTLSLDSNIRGERQRGANLNWDQNIPEISPVSSQRKELTCEECALQGYSKLQKLIHVRRDDPRSL